MKGRDEESSPSDASIPKERGKMRTCLWACPLTPTPQPHHPSPCLCKINMRGSSKVAWIDAIRTTRYPLILMLCCDVFIFGVKQGVPSNEDLEWPYPSCLLYGKEVLKLFARSQSWDINGRSPNPFTRRWQFFLLARKKKQKEKKRKLLVAYVGVYIFVSNDAK